MNYPAFSKENKSLVKKYLTKTLFNRLKTKKTSSGFTLLHAIQSGIINQDSAIGIYAGNAEAYQVFAKIFNPVILDYHSFSPYACHTSDLSPDLELKNPDPENKYIISTRMRCARNIAAFDFMPYISAHARKKLELKVIHGLKLLKFANKNFNGHYISLQNISEYQQVSFTEKHFLFNRNDRFQNAAGINRDWPESRGIFLADDENFIVWVNEEDHLRIISMEKGGNLSGTFNRLCIALSALKKNLEFSFDKNLGYLTSCPSNLGTGMRAGVHIRLPALHKKRELLLKSAESFNLEIRGTRGEKTKVEKSIFDISNRQRLGITEKQCVKNLHKGLTAIIEMENNLERP